MTVQCSSDPNFELLSIRFLFLHTLNSHSAFYFKWCSGSESTMHNDSVCPLIVNARPLGAILKVPFVPQPKDGRQFLQRLLSKYPSEMDSALLHKMLSKNWKCKSAFIINNNINAVVNSIFEVTENVIQNLVLSNYCHLTRMKMIVQ